MGEAWRLGRKRDQRRREIADARAYLRKLGLLPADVKLPAERFRHWQPPPKPHPLAGVEVFDHHRDLD